MKSNRIIMSIVFIMMIMAAYSVAANPLPADMTIAPSGIVFFETGEHFITTSKNASVNVRDQEPALNNILTELKTDPNKILYVDGFVSDPPKYRENNQANQRLLAQNRAMSVANWYINHGIPRDRIRIFEKVSRGMDAYLPMGTNYFDQRVDMYIFDKITGPSIEDVILNLRVICPESYYEYREPLKKDTVNGIMTISLTVECRAADPNPDSEPIVDLAPDPRDDNFLKDPKYWAYTLGGTALGCGGGWALSGIEGGEGARDEDRKAGDGGGICENDGQCIMTGCLIGWGGSQIGYWVDRSLTDFDRNRRR